MPRPPLHSPRRRIRLPRHPVAAAALTLAACLSVALAGPAAAPGQEAPPPAPTIVEPARPGERPSVNDPRLDPALAGVPVTGPEVDAAFARYDADRRARDDAHRREEEARRDLADLATAQERVRATRNQASRRQAKSAAELARLRASLAAIAVEDYMHGASSGAELDWDSRQATDARRRRTLSAIARGQQLIEARLHAAVAAEQGEVAAAAGAELDELTRRDQAANAALAESLTQQEQLAAALVADTQAVADARLTATVRDRDLALVALDAYYRAARRMAGDQPGCRIPWSLLAGIGRTESGHGTFGGSALDATGTVTKPIVGIALDGSAGTAVVRDTDGGLLDGDATQDRAVGPMQFIPSTWARWGRDGNGDGRNDPQNLYDAALAAASYLCVYGPGLDTEAGARGAVIHYNNDASYVDLVYARARGYDTLALAPVR